MEYSVTTKAGKTFTIEHDLTDADAQAVLRAKQGASNFERDLASKRKLSPKQVAWLHVLAFWAQNPRERDADAESFPTILGMLTKAREAGKKFPKIKLRVDGQPIVLALNRAGKVNVTDGGGYGSGRWFGAIQPSGAFYSRDADAVLPVLRDLESDPVTVASQHGVATGECCFCARELTTKESRTVGYGPICAGKFGLPWGHVDPELEKLGSIIPGFES